MKPSVRTLIASLTIVVLASATAHAATPAALIHDEGVGPIAFAASDLRQALTANGYAVTVLPPGDPAAAKPAIRVILTTAVAKLPGQPSTPGLTREGYAIERVASGSATNYWVIGKDAAGAMYGGLERAEAVRLADGLGAVTNRQTNPYLAERAIKFNVPLDARTPSYSDDSDSAQANIANMWDKTFWADLLDDMARHRYNQLSLWSLHPFPSMVRVPEYPNVALADVKEKVGPMWDAGGTGVGMYDSSWELTTLKTMSMDEKIAFWRWVMQYAHDRGIACYLMTWNIFIYGAESTLWFSFKYSQAHMLSSTKPLFIFQKDWFDTIPDGSKVILTVRNDDTYYFRWGAPDFARAYITNLPDRSKISGIYIGPDGYTWGREYVSTEPDSPRQLVMRKMGYFFQIYGRLAYDPTMANSRFEALLDERFPGVSSRNLYEGWATVSKIFPLITRFYWGEYDFQWYPEACWSREGFETVEKFIKPRWDPRTATEDGDRPLLMSVKEFVGGVPPAGRRTPEQVADQLQQFAERGLANIQGLDAGTDKELRLTLGDIKAMSLLGRYYAGKIRGAVALCPYQSGGDAADHAKARAHLVAASNHWKEYAAQWSQQYVKQVLTRMGESSVDIAGIQALVNGDIPPELAAPKD